MDRTVVSLAKTARVITIRLGEDGSREGILYCVGQALDVDAGVLPSEYSYECWAPGTFRPGAGERGE